MGRRLLDWWFNHFELILAVIFIGGMLLIGFRNGWT